jgi:PadR family transcriptional regulator PadR
MREVAMILGEFELIVLLTMLQVSESIYPLALRDAIETKTSRRVSRAAVFITLERLERKGLVSSFYGDPTPIRGGRPKRFFKVEARGITAARRAVRTMKELTVGLETVLELN